MGKFTTQIFYMYNKTETRKNKLDGMEATQKHSYNSNTEKTNSLQHLLGR